jgi:hypothetical protein
VDELWVNVARYAVIACAPAAAFWGAVAALARLAGPTTAPDRAGPPLAERPVEQLAADLRRLSDQLVDLRSSDVAAKSARLQGLELAYDDTLCDACRALDVPAPGPPPLRAAVRLDVELLLAQRGLCW